MTSPNLNDGFLIPRIDNFSTTNPTTDQNAMMVYLNNYLTGVNISGTAKNYTSGFYYWDNAKTDWIKITQNASWYIEGNDNTISGTHFLGTTNAEDVDFRVNNNIRFRMTEKGQLEIFTNGESVYLGEKAGENDTQITGSINHRNVFIGHEAGENNTIGRSNNGIGFRALYSNISGSFNTALGLSALRDLESGFSNIAVGNGAISNNVSGINNVAIGNGAL